MTTYSAHPALASEQLQRSEIATHNSSSKGHHNHSHRRHKSAGASGIASGNCGGVSLKMKSSNKSTKTTCSSTATTSVDGVDHLSDVTVKCSDGNKALSQRALSERTDFVDDDDDVDNFADEEDNTKDCIASVDEPDHVQRRFPRTRDHHNDRQQLYARESDNITVAATATTTTTTTTINGNPNSLGDVGCISGLSSTISSPSVSTVSSPFSTPTRLAPQLQHSHQHCCYKPSAPPLPHHLHHQQQHHASHQQSPAAGGSKKLQKFDPRFGPSPYRQLLPIVLCILSFATVLATLIIYMDTTVIRHQQFRLNMSRDYDVHVAQDDPTLIAFLREIHLRKYSMHFLKNRDTTPIVTTSLNFSAEYHDELAPRMANYVSNLLGGKTNGAVIQSLPGALGQLMTAPWLAETLNWAGIVIEPEARRYFSLRKQYAQRQRLQVVHACVSPDPFPKEIPIHNEESDVRINSLDEETTWFNSRVKCFPLYTLMLACDRVEYDLLSLGVYRHELDILHTLPFDKIKIEIISIHLLEDDDELHSYIQSITKFLMGKSYRLQKNFGCNYFYQRISSSTSRTRKKDIFLLKTP